jgi:hypothetical protein
LAVGDLRTDVTQTCKGGGRGRLCDEYGEHRDPQAALSWEFVNRAERPPASSTAARRS